MADQQRDVIEILEHDHREVEQMFTELETLRGATSDDGDLMESGGTLAAPVQPLPGGGCPPKYPVERRDYCHRR